MIWVNFAKTFLAAVAASDISFLQENLSDNFILETKNYSFSKAEVIKWYKTHQPANVSILDYCYKDKTIFFTCLMHDEEVVMVVIINNEGKISKFKVYYLAEAETHND